MEQKTVFGLIFEYDYCDEDTYQVTLEKLTEELYTDGMRFFKLTEEFLYLIEGEDTKGKEKKKRIAKRKGKDLILSTVNDKVVFSPTAIIQNVSTFY